MKPSIRIYRKPSGYRATFIAPNGEPVGSTSKGYPTPQALYEALVQMRDTGQWSYDANQNKKGEMRYIFLGELPNKPIRKMQVIRSEPYTSLQKAQQGTEACQQALATGRCALEFSESSDLYALDALLQNPELGQAAAAAVYT